MMKAASGAAEALLAAERTLADAHAGLERARGAAADERQDGLGGSATLARLDGASASAAEIVAILRRDGTVVLEGMMRLEQIESLQQELAALEEFAHRAEPGSFSGENTVSNGPYLVAACPTAQELALHPKLIEIVEQTLSPHARRVALAVASEIKVSGGGPAQVLHRDDEEWPLDLLAYKKPGAELELNSMWAVSDFAAEAGATQQVPGSHVWPAGRKPSPDEVAIAEMPRGSVLLWLGSTLHGAGPSTPEAATRHGMLLGYCLSWLRPEMNMQWACPPEVAASLDPRLATLLGFAGSDRYGKHPYKIGPAFATEYNGYPGDEVDYGSATDKDWNAEGGRETKHQACFEPGDLTWLGSKL